MATTCEMAGLKEKCEIEFEGHTDDVVLKRFKDCWRLLLDTESVPKSGTNANATEVALDFIYGDSRLTAPLRRYRDVVGAALFVENALDVVIAAAERKRDAAKAENAARNDGRDRAGEGIHAAFHHMLTDRRLMIKRVCMHLRNGERADDKTLHALPHDPTWPNVRERKRAAMARELETMSDEDDDGFGPIRQGKPVPKGGKLIDY